MDQSRPHGGTFGRRDPTFAVWRRRLTRPGRAGARTHCEPVSNPGTTLLIASPHSAAPGADLLEGEASLYRPIDFMIRLCELARSRRISARTSSVALARSALPAWSARSASPASAWPPPLPVGREGQPADGMADGLRKAVPASRSSAPRRAVAATSHEELFDLASECAAPAPTSSQSASARRTRTTSPTGSHRCSTCDRPGRRRLRPDSTAVVSVLSLAAPARAARAPRSPTRPRARSGCGSDLVDVGRHLHVAGGDVEVRASAAPRPRRRAESRPGRGWQGRQRCRRSTEQQGRAMPASSTTCTQPTVATMTSRGVVHPHRARHGQDHRAQTTAFSSDA